METYNKEDAELSQLSKACDVHTLGNRVREKLERLLRMIGDNCRGE